jgi:predicted lipoprotein with Yx(FWY)xxD motif
VRQRLAPGPANGQPTAGDGANASIVATIKRSDGAPQVTYNGHPLYLYEGDHEPGDTNGQGVVAFGAGWYALTPAGDQVSGTSSSGDSSGY